MAAWSFEEVLKRGGIISRTVHTELFFFMWLLKKKKISPTHWQSLPLLTLFWKSDSLIEHFSWNLRNLKFFLFFCFLIFLLLEDKKKETGVPLLVWNFNRCLYLMLSIRIQVFELSTWKLSCRPTFPEGDYDVSSSFFLSDKYICGQEDARTPLQKLWSTVGWDKPWFGNQETWTLALEICLNPDFWPQECH